MPASQITYSNFIPSGRVAAVIRSATRRRLFALAVAEFALAFALLFGGGILMLLLGTQILNWYWLVLLGAIGVGVGVFRVLRSRMAPYRVAQLLDEKFQLSDSLSTAWFLSSGPDRRQDVVAQFQIARAEELAGAVQVADAFPVRGHRTWALAGVLAAVAFGLFAVRYMVTNSLSVQQSLIPIHLDSVFERSEDPHSREARRAPDSSANDQSANLSPFTRENTPRGDANQPQDGKQNSAEGSASSSSSPQNADPQGNKTSQQGRTQAREGGRPNGEAKSGEKSDAAPGEQAGAKTNPDSKNPSTSSQQGSQGLMDRMKDALSSMMAKMHGQNSPGSPQDNKRHSADGKTGNPSSTNKDQAGQQKSASNQQSSQEQNSTGQAQGETKEKAQASQGQTSDQSTESGSDSRSGVGRQDGDKALKEANQLQAMGKLEEIIGKRSANLTGEMTVETPSNKQQLKTAYSQHQGHHADLGGEINRDEIPLMYQQYVREYMEQVRKQGNGGQ